MADFETFEEEPQPDGTIALASVSFANVHLRMDGSGMKSASDSGAGSVNCQFGAGPWEKFLEPAPPFPTIKWPKAADPGTSAAAATAASSGSGAGADSWDDADVWEEESGDDYVDDAGGDFTNSTAGTDEARTSWEGPFTP